MHMNDDLIPCLLRYGSDINSQNRYGDAPLHIAVSHENIDCIKALMDGQADTKTNTGTQ